MTPQERQLVSELFDRLSSLENSPRDPDAERTIAQGFSRAPNAAYALVQTVLVQDEALKRAEARIQELEGTAHTDTGFLDSMRSVFLGTTQAPRGSVPSISAASKWNSGQVAGGFQNNAPPPQQQAYAPEPPRAGGSFLGTAAAAAAGVIGGSMLFSGLSSMMGGHRGSAFASSDSDRGSPWGGSDSSNSDLSRDAGLKDIGGGRRGSDNDRGGASGLFGSNDDDDNDSDDNDFADSGDFGGGDSSDA